jgi:hypothetical protein
LPTNQNDKSSTKSASDSLKDLKKLFNWCILFCGIKIF